MTYGAERIAPLRCPLPRGHTELSAHTWTSVTPLPVTHLLGCQSGTGRLDTAAGPPWTRRRGRGSHRGHWHFHCDPAARALVRAGKPRCRPANQRREL